MELRWPVVLLCSYFLLYSGEERLGPEIVQAILFFYLLSNLTLYLFHQGLFELRFFRAALVVFDTICLLGTLALVKQAGADLYLAYFLIVLLSSVSDFAGAILVAILASVVYGYIILQNSDIHDPLIYLRLPFPLVISLFYGYFAQLVRSERALRKKAIEEAETTAMIHSLSQSVGSSLDREQILLALGNQIALVLNVEKLAVFFLDNREAPEALLFDITRGRLLPTRVRVKDYPIIEECLGTLRPACRGIPAGGEVKGDRRAAERESGEEYSPVARLATPIAFGGRTYGAILFRFRQSIGSKERELCKMVGFALSQAIHNSEVHGLIKRQAQELEQSSRVKDEFLSVMSHELRSPLTALLGYTEMMGARLFGEINEKQERALKKITSRSKELLTMINNILQVTRIEAGAGAVARHDVRLSPFLDGLRSFFDLPIEKDVTLVWEYGSDLPVVNTDSGKLRQILENLVNNAVKFTDKGQVTISVKVKESRSVSEFEGFRGEVVLRVSDTGIGIPRESLPIIFDRFHQVDSSDTRSHSGVGMGLFITKKFVELLGGRMGVESQVGEGTTFTVTIPVNPDREQK